MELLSNLLLYSPGHSGFSSYVRRVMPALPGHRLLLDGPAGAVCRQDDRLPELGPSSRAMALLQRLSLTQHGVNVVATLAAAGLSASDPEVVYSPYCDRLFALPGIPQVITCHDLTPLHLPNSRKAAWRLRHWLPRHLHGAQRVIAISRFVADQLMEEGLPADRIRIVPNGIEGPSSPRSAATGSDLLMLARHDRNKNVLHGIRGFALLLRQRPGWAGSLLVVGREGRCTKDIQRAVRELGLQKRVRLIAALSEEQLAEQLSASLALISASSMEGFDYPVLEAMAAGVPTLISAIPVHRELYEGAALLFELDDGGESLAAAIARLKREPALWQDLSQRGIKRATQFSLSRQQETILAVIEEARLPNRSPG
jgi:glycosyltransferase involved in cell wall biosynthesis